MEATTVSGSARNLVAGSWRRADPDEVTTRVSPVDPDVRFARPAETPPATVTECLEAARRAQARWAQSGAAERSRVLHAMADSLRAAAGRLADTLVLEVGKTPAEAAGEVENAARVLDFFAGSALRQRGRVFDSSQTRNRPVTWQEPVGVAALITPWNFPINLAAIKIGPAIAAGNTAVLKPAPEAALTATRMVEALRTGTDAPDLLSVVHGDGETGSTLVDSELVGAVAFTGSSAVGSQVAARAASRGVPATCEMGGKNALTVLADADLEAAVEATVQGAFRMAGQKCTATSRLLVHEEVAGKLLDRLQRRLAEVSPPIDPRESDAFLGPVIDAHSAERIVGSVRDAARDGAELLWPADGPPEPVRETYVQPTVLRGVTPDMPIHDREVFGPVLEVSVIDGLAEAVDLVDAVPYGLTASIFTDSGAATWRFLDSVDVGVALVNRGTAGLEFHVPFGGRRDSGLGLPEQSDDSLAIYSHTKVAYVTW